MQTFVFPSSVAQVQIIGPPPGMNQVQYQIHPGQPLQIQGMPPPGSQNSPQPMTQMYVMSQPPPQQNFMSSSAPINGAVSYVYTQPRPTTPSQSMIEAVNVNLQQPPPSGNIINLYLLQNISLIYVYILLKITLIYLQVR